MPGDAAIKVRNDEVLRNEMNAAGLDAVVAFSMENVFYLSGALFALQDNIRDRLSCAVVTADGADALICATNEQSGIEARCHTAELLGYVEFRKTAIDLLVDLIERLGLARGRIGIETHYLMAAYWEDLRTRLPQARLVSADRVIERTRAIKLPVHIEKIAAASRASERALAAAFAEAQPGDSEKALAIRITAKLMEAGCDVVRHNVVTVGDNARHAHPYPSDAKRLEPRDVIRVDCGGLFEGFGSDIARMAVVGPPSEAQARHYATLRSALTRTAAAIRPGVPARDVYEAAVAAYAAEGVPGYTRDHVGHSLSILGSHDEPMLHAASDWTIEEGMVLALEPIFRDAEGRRYTVEDTFAVTGTGARLLTDVMDTAHMTRIG